MTLDTAHCAECGRAFDAPDVDRDPHDPDRCTDCLTPARVAVFVAADDEPQPETMPDEIL